MTRPNSDFRRNAFRGALVAVALLSSCKKNLPKQPQSTWQIDTETFSTNDVDVATYNNQSLLAAHWRADEYDLMYRRNANRLPDNGLYKLNSDELDFDSNYISIYIQNKKGSFSGCYYFKEDSLASPVTVSRPDGVFTITIPPTRFRKCGDTLNPVVLTAILRYKE